MYSYLEKPYGLRTCLDTERIGTQVVCDRCGVAGPMKKSREDAWEAVSRFGWDRKQSENMAPHEEEHRCSRCVLKLGHFEGQDDEDE